MKRPISQYPDISDILARKAEGRRQLAALSFSEKLLIMDALKERDEFMRRVREMRRRAKAQRG